MMEDMETREWGRKLQEARTIFKKIIKLPQGEERENLLKKHKDSLEEARKKLQEINGQSDSTSFPVH